MGCAHFSFWPIPYGDSAFSFSPFSLYFPYFLFKNFQLFAGGMAKIRFHLFNLFPMLHLLILLLFISTVQSAPPTMLQNSIGHPTGNTPVTQEEISAVSGNYEAVYIVRAINRRATILAQLENAAIETVRRNLPPVRSDTLQQSLWEVSLLKGGKYLWNSANRMIGIGNNQVPKTPAELEKEKLRQMNEPQFWVKLLRSSKLTDEQRATLIVQLPLALSNDDADKKRYMEGLDELIIYFERKIKKLEQDMARMNQNVDGYEQLRLKGNDEGSSTNPHPAKSQLPHANLFKLCHKICVGTVDFLAQIRLEIQLHWDFKWLEIEHLTDYLEYAYENRQDIYWSDQFFKGLIDFNKTVDKVHKHMLDFQYAFRESEDPPQAKYLTSIFEVAQFALLWKDTNGNDLPDKKNMCWERMEELVIIWHMVVNLIQPKMAQLGFKMHENIYTKLEMPKEWFAEIRQEAHLDGPPQVPTDKMLINRVKFTLAQTLLAYERLNAFYRIDHFHKLWKDKEFPVGERKLAYNHLSFIFSKYKCAEEGCPLCKGPIVGHKP